MPEWNPQKPTEREIVPGIPVVRQPVILATDEWRCGGCGAPVVMDDDGKAEITHEHGCSAMASVYRQING
jgi:hypothetical protein